MTSTDIVTSSAPDAPAHLDAAQADVWRATVLSVGVPLTDRALADLEAYAVERARQDAAEQHLRLNGDVLVLRSDKGDVIGSKEAPELRIARTARALADELAERLELREARPAGDRDTRGRFARGNSAAAITSSRSVRFWREQQAELQRVADAVLTSRGYTRDTAPVELRVAADGLAQARLIRDSAFAKIAELGSPLSGSDRERGAARVWAGASDRTLRHVQAVQSYPVAERRVPSVTDWLEQRAEAPK